MNKNYSLIEKRELPEIASTSYLYRHVSGAEILHIKNKDDNKVFDIIFRTPICDSTGVPHILEHSVLNGSEKYPIKDPFGTLMKGSLVTFLNAMTFDDKTMYPVASRNDKDFMNLMGVYLDSAFRPLIHAREYAFLQEGWHYDLESPDGELKINGVVYNEMKGELSDPSAVLHTKLQELVYPESGYRFNAGGDPDVIPELTYQDFKDFHKTYYSPSDSYVYFYGDMDIERCFELLDEYLTVDKAGVKDITKERCELLRQTPLSAPVYGKAQYSIAENDDPAGKSWLAAAYMLDDFPAPLLKVSMAILNNILMETPASPLRNGLLEKKLGEAVMSQFEAHMNQPQFELAVKNSGFDCKVLKDAMTEILNGIVKNGLDKKFVEACLNAFEFKLREREGWGPKGLSFLIENLEGWTFGKNPFDYASPIKSVTEIRNRIAAGEPYFENLIKKYILNNNFSGYLTLEASPGLQTRKDEELRKKLETYKKSLTADQLSKLADKKKELTELQNTPDTPEALATIPMVSLDDIKKESKAVLLEQADGLLFADVQTDGLAYNNFLFDIKSLNRAELSAAGIIMELLGKLDTRKRGFADLISEINLRLGGIDFMFGSYFGRDGVNFTPSFQVKVKALETKIPDMFALALEILTETLFDDKERIKMLLSEVRAELESEFISRGNYFGVLRARSYLGDKYAYADLVDGYGFYEYLKSVTEDFDKNFDALRDSLYSVSRKIFNQKSLDSAMACSRERLGNAEKEAKAFMAALPQGSDLVKLNESLIPRSKNEAFIMESMVSYNVITADFTELGFQYSGAMGVLSNVISEGYLLQEIRVKGGAYGYSGMFGLSAGGYGLMRFYSYRDPNLERTYKVYKEAEGFLESFNPDAREMLQYVLGAVNKLDAPLTPSKQLEYAINMKYTGMTGELLQQERDELLGTDAAKIRAFAPMVSKCVSQNNICTFGSGDAINANKDIFNSLRKI